MSQPQLKPLEIEALLTQYRSDLRKLEYQIHQTQSIIQGLEKQAAEVQEALAIETSTAPPAAEKTTAKRAAKGRPKKSGRKPGRPPKAKPAKAADKAPEAKAETTKAPEAKAPEAKAAETKAPEAKAPAAKKTAGRRPSKKSAEEKSPAVKKKGPGRPRKSTAEKKTEKAAKKESPEKKGPGYRLSEWDNFVFDCLKAKQQALITQDFLDIAKANPDIKSGEAQIKVKLNRSLHKLSNKKGALVKVEHSGRGYAYALSEWVNTKGELPKKFAR
ncbi:MAG: hypothetical protein H6556_01740 [Lewinellaceae bacterium]|nr:hypothetical protein [Lewinellaceae bacterium]